jgi:hypothetical protein
MHIAVAKTAQAARVRAPLAGVRAGAGALFGSIKRLVRR